jgi:ketosteroid isomerase-like protein
MSDENVELAMAASDAYNSGDIEAVMSFYAPDVEVLPDASVFPEAHRLHGREDYKRWLEEIGTAWVKNQAVVREVIALEDGRVLHRYEWGGEGVASGIEIASTLTAIFSIRDGLISRVEWFFDHDKALEAAGLSG